ncbi:phosphatase RsbU N-terminal domain-containing protein [Nocardioides pelophilus]|uniref:phosphatase RsbU N-terminal domain-containing protein n=1 Tax=Nocardioides pelophilus TaxID=2172019 RepID=UPI0016023152|nr:phosphatase RsbU N-terminal domain-containing protein [Nocardioides pelophilus]
MTDRVESMRRDYRAAFLGYVAGGAEGPLALAYELGRAAVAERTNVLVLGQIHHEILGEVLRTASPEEVAVIVDRAGEFLGEVLAAVDLMQRSLAKE